MVLKIRSAIRGFFFHISPAPTWTIPLALLALTGLSYGLRALSLGFFWDDWPYLWFFHRLGPAGILAAFSGDRPFLSFIYTLSLTIFGSSSQAWQIFALLARWLCGLGLWWALAQAWPRQANKAAWAAMLFTVYPGFTQQWISVIYGQAFFLFSAVFFSTGITLWLARCRGRLSRGWFAAGTLLALALSAFCMFSTEYFFGLELLRPILLWVLFTNEQPGNSRKILRERTWKTLRWWAPFLGLMLLFVLWRGLIHPFTGYKLTTLNGMEQSPLNTLRGLSLAILHDLVVSSLAAWGQAFQPLSGLYDLGVSNGLRLLGVIGGVGLLFFLYLSWLRPRFLQKEQPEFAATPNWALQASLVGLLTILCAGWPTWMTSLPMRMGFPLDRYALSMSVGVSILLAGLLDAFGKNWTRKAILLALALGLAAGFQNTTALAYRSDWNAARDFFWQLTWRAPAVKPDTLFASDSLPFRYFEDDSLSAPLNWVYDPNGTSTQMNYILYDLYVRRLSMPAYQPGLPVEHAFRATEFSGSTSQTILFYYAPPGCVRVLDPVNDANFYNLPARLLKALPISNPRQVITDQTPPAAPPTDLFGSEPKHEWCYYFEKAELARQQGDWKTVYQLGKQAIGSGYRPEDPAEYLPFVEGYARAGKLDDAYQLTRATGREAPALRPALCAAWQRTYQAAPDIPSSYRDGLKAAWGCVIPR